MYESQSSRLVVLGLLELQSLNVFDPDAQYTLAAPSLGNYAGLLAEGWRETGGSILLGSGGEELRLLKRSRLGIATATAPVVEAAVEAAVEAPAEKAKRRWFRRRSKATG